MTSGTTPWSRGIHQFLGIGVPGGPQVPGIRGGQWVLKSTDAAGTLPRPKGRVGAEARDDGASAGDDGDDDGGDDGDYWRRGQPNWCTVPLFRKQTQPVRCLTVWTVGNRDYSR